MKKKGFTLIELLAVIVILAIIAVITVPKVADMIESSRKGAAVDSFYGTLKAAELSYARAWQSNNNLKETECTFNDDVTCTNGVTFSSSGANPKSGRITIIDSYPYGSELEYNGYTCTGSLESEHPCIKKGTTKPECFSTENNSDGSLSITDYDTKCGTDVVIPSKINGKKVTKIADGKALSDKFVGPFALKGITSVKIPDTITYIGYAAFFGNKIENLEIPSSVKIIWAYAFYNNGMKTLKLNNGLKEISVWAFSSNQLTHVDFPDSLTNIGIVSFMNNKLTKIDIPKSVTELGGGAFSHNSVTGEDANIYGRKSDGSENKTLFKSYAGTKMDTLNISDEVTAIDQYAFYNVPINNIIIPGRIKNIGSYAFYASSAKSLILNEGLETIGSNSFTGNYSLEEVNVPSTIKAIYTNAFYSETLKTINIKRANNAIAGAPWGATKATVNWTGTN